jgi:preprotein translocase subunit SecE
VAKTTKQPQEKPKRRLRPASQTVRERSEKTAQAPSKPSKKVSRKTPKPLRVAGQPFKWIGRFIFPRFLRNAFLELRHVTWPSRRESRQLTTAVIIFSLIFGVFVSLLDYGISQLFKKVILNQ